jgi:mannuronan 5-epimerase
MKKDRDSRAFRGTRVLSIIFLTVLFSSFFLANATDILLHENLAFGSTINEVQPIGSAVSMKPLIASPPLTGNLTKEAPLDEDTITPKVNEIRNKINNTIFSDRVSLADCVDYDNKSRSVIVSCNLSLSDINNAIDNDKVLRNEPNEKGVWFLNSSLIVRKGSILTISSEDGVKWLKISSGGNLSSQSPGDTTYHGPHRIRIFGSLNMDGTKITSWDPVTKNYTTQNLDGSILRPYIVVEPRADLSLLTNSEIAFLGYNSAGKQGLSLYGGDGTILEGNRIHDLWFGFFSDNVGNIMIENNTLFHNSKYGLSSRAGSDIAIENNRVFDNTVGLMCSQGCHKLLVQKNEFQDNNEAGLVFSRNVSDSVARYNNVSDSDIGIAASESYANDISGNSLSDNRFGLHLKGGSTLNIINNNTIANAIDCGILAAGKAEKNSILHNSVYHSAKNGICLSQGSVDNRFYSNMIDSVERFGVNVKDRDSRNNIFEGNIIRLAENGIMLDNNTETTFVNNILHEIKDIQYIISNNSTLNLEKNPAVSSKIKSIGPLDNSVNIRDSGRITSINDDQDIEQDPFVTSTHDSDNSPYITKLSPGTILELESTPYSK